MREWVDWMAALSRSKCIPRHTVFPPFLKNNTKAAFDSKIVYEISSFVDAMTFSILTLNCGTQHNYSCAECRIFIAMLNYV